MSPRDLRQSYQIRRSLCRKATQTAKIRSTGVAMASLILRSFSRAFVFKIVVLNLVTMASDATIPSLDSQFSAPKEIVRETPLSFQRHVIPLLGRLGCNGRACHGSFQGQGGFRLSMFGYDFHEDYQSLTAGPNSRISKSDPQASLILKKPTTEEEHEGGKRLERDSWQYRVLRRWIEQGATEDSGGANHLIKLEVFPLELIFSDLGEQRQLEVIAHWDDGSREDVTCLTRFHSTDEGTVQVDEQGRATATGRGDAHVIASYDLAVSSINAIMPVSKLVGVDYPQVITNTMIDELVLGKLRKLGIVPAEICSDEEFLRRVSLDITGSLPLPDEIRRFLTDSNPHKRSSKINELLQRPAYSVWWGTLLCDYTGLNAPLQLGNTDFAKPVGDQWTAWIERKLRDNVPYDKLVEGIVVATSRKPGQSYREFALEQSQYTRTVQPVDFAAQEKMPHFWHRENLKEPEQKALAFAYSFLGVRLDCAQCHKHPFDRWTKQDFDQFAACFDRVRKGVSPECQQAYDEMVTELGVTKNTTAAERRGKYLRLAAEGNPAPWKEVYIGEPEKPREPGPNSTPKILGEAELQLGPTDDPRVSLMQWLRDEDNPYFARAIINRVWAQYFGRGIVHPPDDQNLGNPPSNPALLDYLSLAFVKNSYDLKWLHRQIANSATYQRSCRTNDTNRLDERNFSHAIVRRLPAEVVVDALLQSTARSDKLASFQTIMKDRRISVQATADHRRTEFGLAVFGKPLRNTNCDCEREMLPSLLQSVFLRNDKDMLAALDRTDGWLKELASESIDQEHAAPLRSQVVNEAYLRTLGRMPDEGEYQRAVQYFDNSADDKQAQHDLLWVLINTQEFVTNH